MRHNYQPEFFEAKYAEREDLFRAFFDLPLVGAAISTRSKNWIAVNDRACQILGYPRDILNQKSWVEITHPDDLENCLSHFQRWLSGEINEYSIEKRFIQQDGNIVWAILSGGRTRMPGGDPDLFFLQLLDITERKRAEADLSAARKEIFEVKKSLSLAKLTPRERDVAYYLIKGLTNKEIAEQIGSSVHTIDTHIRHIFKKLEINSRAEFRRAMGAY